jgi:hypothetical protein
MALNSGFENLDSSADSFSDWLNKTNEMITLMREDVLTANSTIANTSGDARLLGSFIANTVHIVNDLYGGDLYANGSINSSNLQISTNTYFANTCDEVHVQNDLRISGNLIYILDESNFENIIPSADDTYTVGRANAQWQGYFSNLTVGANTTMLNLEVTGNTNLSNLTLSGGLTTANLEVTGTADIQTLNLQELTANGFAMIGNETSVTVSTPTVIDSFDKTQSKGFKYIIHAVNSGDSSSVFTLELMCGHNGTQMFFTRYGELTNNFTATLVPQISGSNVQLVATCPNATVSNVHTFNILRIETR